MTERLDSNFRTDDAGDMETNIPTEEKERIERATNAYEDNLRSRGGTPLESAQRKISAAMAGQTDKLFLHEQEELADLKGKSIEEAAEILAQHGDSDFTPAALEASSLPTSRKAEILARAYENKAVFYQSQLIKKTHPEYKNITRKDIKKDYDRARLQAKLLQGVKVTYIDNYMVIGDF